jgi:PAS domain S-box-containing protein
MNTAGFFDSYFNTARITALVVLDTNGKVMMVNQSFSNQFGYTQEDVEGKYFDFLFTEEDKLKKKPESELHKVNHTGQSTDENFVVAKSGHRIWCTGESILTTTSEGQGFIIKEIINLQEKRQMQLLLTETEELLEHISDSSTDLPMMILDGSLKIQKVNRAFMDFFEVHHVPPPGSRLSDLDHPFWNTGDIKKNLGKIIVNNASFSEQEFSVDTSKGATRVKLTSKVIDSKNGNGRRIFILLSDPEDERPPAQS